MEVLSFVAGLDSNGQRQYFQELAHESKAKEETKRDQEEIEIEEDTQKGQSLDLDMERLRRHDEYCQDTSPAERPTLFSRTLIFTSSDEEDNVRASRNQRQIVRQGQMVGVIQNREIDNEDDIYDVAVASAQRNQERGMNITKSVLLSYGQGQVLQMEHPSSEILDPLGMSQAGHKKKVKKVVTRKLKKRGAVGRQQPDNHIICHHDNKFGTELQQSMHQFADSFVSDEHAENELRMATSSLKENHNYADNKPVLEEHKRDQENRSTVGYHGVSQKDVHYRNHEAEEQAATILCLDIELVRRMRMLDIYDVIDRNKGGIMPAHIMEDHQILRGVLQRIAHIDDEKKTVMMKAELMKEEGLFSQHEIWSFVETSIEELELQKEETISKLEKLYERRELFLNKTQEEKNVSPSSLERMLSSQDMLRNQIQAIRKGHYRQLLERLMASCI